MTDTEGLKTLERASYRETYSDGIIDIFVGVSLLWIGAAWIWLPDLAGIAGVFPAVFVTSALLARKRFIESRAGYVKWTEPRRRWERRNLWIVFAGGVATFMAGIGAFFAAGSGDTHLFDALAPGLLAFLLALLAVALAFLMDAGRMLGYAAVLFVAGAITAWADANPGWPLLAGGAGILLVGIVLLARFARHNPRVEAP